MHEFQRNHNYNSDQTRSARKRRAEILMEAIEKIEIRLNIEFSDKFKSYLAKYLQFEANIPGLRAVNSVLREWKIWEAYAEPDGFVAFFEDAIRSLIQIEVTGTCGFEGCEAYIGKKIGIKPTAVIPPMYTTVDINGNFKIDGINA